MEKFTTDEENLLNSLKEPIRNININLVNSIIDKMLINEDYYNLMCFLNLLYDFAELPADIVNKLIKEDNKTCISSFLEKEEDLYFLKTNEINTLKSFLNVREVNIKLDKSYDYYYDLLYNQGVRLFKEVQINDNIKEYQFTRYNRRFNIKLKEIKNVGLVVSSVNYCNYNLSEEEQLQKVIEFINEYGFNVDSNAENFYIN